MHFVVRQPIVDLHSRVHAFKLLFRERPLTGEAESDGRQSLRSMAGFGLEKPSELKRLTGALAAYVECTEEMLSAQMAHALPANLAILEIPPALEPSAETIATCWELKTLGFRLAMSEFQWEPCREPLVEMADYMAIDFGGTDSETRRDLCARMQGKRTAMLADKVQTQAEYSQAREEGFSLFAGSYYYQPVAGKERRPPANQLLRIEILKGLQQRPMDLRKMSQLVMRDGPLAFQLLRFVNSPICALRQEVKSIETALLTLGEDVFRRIATLAIASQFNGNQPAEILCMAIIRGRFCEVAGLSRELDPFNQYLLGLLSLLPAMQGLPMCEIAPTLPLGIEIRAALMGTKNPARSDLGWLESYEHGDWDACDAAALADGLNQEKLAMEYVEAVEWAEAALHSTT
ncbi:MAG: EAL and HDOD domain-containing protein [Terracidiphilus sp.]